ncbi:hypothetical protein NFI96_025507, partial [Prochilodus magdalenae]
STARAHGPLGLTFFGSFWSFDFFWRRLDIFTTRRP